MHLSVGARPVTINNKSIRSKQTNLLRHAELLLPRPSFQPGCQKLRWLRPCDCKYHVLLQTTKMNTWQLVCEHSGAFCTWWTAHVLFWLKKNKQKKTAPCPAAALYVIGLHRIGRKSRVSPEILLLFDSPLLTSRLDIYCWWFSISAALLSCSLSTARR